MDSTVITAVVMSFMIAGFVKGTVGFGMPATAIALLSTFLGVREAIPLVVIPAVLFNIFQAEIGPSLLPMIRRFWSLLLFLAIGIWIGTHFINFVDASILSSILGLMLALYVILSLMKFKIHIQPSSEPYFSPVVGGVSGVVAGMTGTILVPFIFYMQALNLGRDEFVRAVGLSLFIASTFWIAALYKTGILTFDDSILSLAAMIPTGFGFAIGLWCRHRLPQERFRIWVLIALLLTAMNLLRKGLFLQ